MLSLFRYVLGARFDQLAPVLRKHYDLGPNSTMTAHGKMDVWLRAPLMRVAASFIPAAGKNIETTLVIRSFLDSRGQPCLEWRRVFNYGRRSMESFSIQRAAPRPLITPSMMEYFTHHRGPSVGVTYMLQPSKDGEALAQVSVGNQYLMLGENMLPQPWGARINIESVEHAVDANTFYTNVKISHPIMGQLCAYSGQFTIQS